MKQLIKLLMTGVVFSMCFVGCGVTDPKDEDSVSIIITDIGNISAGDQKPIDGTIKGDPDPDPTGISAKIYDSTDAEVPAAQITVSKQTPQAKSEFDLTDDCAFKIVTTALACNGSYTLKISAKAGSAETTKPANFKVVNGINCSGTAISTITLEAGANENTSKGSSIELDGNGAVWLSTEAANNVAKIDLCYAHTASAGDKVGNAKWAEGSSYNFASGWVNPPDNKIKSVNMTAAEFDDVSTAEEIALIWIAAGSEESSLTVEQGDVFIVETTEDNYALVKVTAQTAGSTGAITIKVAK